MTPQEIPMLTLARLLVLTLLLTITSLAVAEDAPAPPRAVTEIIASDGAFSFSDGSSLYTFRQDHSFSLEPLGISGQTITGLWSVTDDGLFLISGQWGWVNGVSPDDDYRELLLRVHCTGDKHKATDTYRDIDVYPVYFHIERLSKIKKSTPPLVPTTP
jgi:hypothetical protein